MEVVAGWNHTESEDNAGGCSDVEAQFASEEVGHSAKDECSENHAHDSQGKQVGNIIGLKKHLNWPRNMCQGGKNCETRRLLPWSRPSYSL